jgi:tetratricopeptide (TPR) repeat protein
VLALYARTAGFEYVFDDEHYLLKNRGLALGPTWAGVQWAFTSFYHANWHPLTWLAHLADRALFGAGAGPAHLVNAALHALCAALLLRLLHRLTGALWPSAFAAALFALHPLRVESVAWVTERKDPLSAIFLILAVGAYLRYCRRPGPARYGAVAALFALGLMSKPSVVILPFALLLLDFWPLGRWRPWTLPGAAAPAPGLARLAAEKLPLLALSAASSVVTYLAQQRGGAVRSLELIGPAMRLENAVVSYVDYLRQSLWPSGLAPYYPHPITAIGAAKVAGAALLLAALTWGAARAARSAPWLVVGWLWFLGTLVPVIGLLQVGTQARADRYTYLPHIGLAAALAWEAARQGARLPRGRLVIGGAGIAVAALLAALTSRQLEYWRDTRSLFTRSLTETGENALAHYNLGVLDAAEGRAAAAVDHYRAAIRLSPGFVPPHVNLGLLLEERGGFAEAEEQYREALRLDPGSAEAHVNYGKLLARRGDRPGAIEHYGAALRVDPGLAWAHMNLGNVLDDEGRTGEALAHYREALRLEPGNADVHYNLGLTLEKVGRRSEAEREYREALRLDPAHPKARRHLDALVRPRP